MTDLSKQAIHEASAWLAELASGEATDDDKRRWRQWHARSEENRAAWTRIEQFRQQFRNLPADLVHGSVDRADETVRQRRTMLKGVLAIAVLGPLAYTGYRQTNWHADYRTSVGEMKTVLLADGTELILNTDTAIDGRFDSTWRKVRLLQGELLVTTAKSAIGSRPFVVETAHGTVRALGTRFSVRADDDHSRVNVLESATLIEPSASPGESMRFEAGHRADFDRHRIRDTAMVDENHIAWTRRMLVVNDWTLDDFITELSRYRPGRLVCRPSVSQLRISGSFPLDNTDRILASLPNTLPVRVHQMSRYWVWVDQL